MFAWNSQAGDECTLSQTLAQLCEPDTPLQLHHDQQRHPLRVLSPPLSPAKSLCSGLNTLADACGSVFGDTHDSQDATNTAEDALHHHPRARTPVFSGLFGVHSQTLSVAGDSIAGDLFSLDSGIVLEASITTTNTNTSTTTTSLSLTPRERSAAASSGEDETDSDTSGSDDDDESDSDSESVASSSLSSSYSSLSSPSSYAPQRRQRRKPVKPRVPRHYNRAPDAQSQAKATFDRALHGVIVGSEDYDLSVHCWECNVCDTPRAFRAAALLVKHGRQEHGRFMCAQPGCGLSYTTWHGWNAHRRVCATASACGELFGFTCPLGGCLFAADGHRVFRMLDMWRHLTTKHGLGFMDTDDPRYAEAEADLIHQVDEYNYNFCDDAKVDDYMDTSLMACTFPGCVEICKDRRTLERHVDDIHFKYVLCWDEDKKCRCRFDSYLEAKAHTLKRMGHTAQVSQQPQPQPDLEAMARPSTPVGAAPVRTQHSSPFKVGALRRNNQPFDPNSMLTETWD